MLVEVAFNENFTQMDENDLRIETSKWGIVRKREGISPEEKKKNLIQDDGVVISVISIPKKKKRSLDLFQKSSFWTKLK